jgi:hypothetical protein
LGTTSTHTAPVAGPRMVDGVDTQGLGMDGLTGQELVAALDTKWLHSSTLRKPRDPHPDTTASTSGRGAEPMARVAASDVEVRGHGMAATVSS